MDTSILLENTPLEKFIRNHIWDSGGVFSIFSLVKISMTSLICFTIKLYLNLLLYDRNIFGRLLRQFSGIFGNKQFSLVNVCDRDSLGDIRRDYCHHFLSEWDSGSRDAQ